ncbi:MAG: Crp/Fnr family transcriptional regulator [Cytophagaceae bacterium]
MNSYSTIDTTALHQHLQFFQVLTEVDIQNFISLGRQRSYKKGECFIQEGEVCEEVTFVLNGILRSYYLTDKGEEITYCITFPNNFMTAYSSYITGMKSQENIQAITNVELLSFSKQSLQKLLVGNIQWMEFSKMIAEYQYMELEKRIFNLQRTSAAQRYEELMRDKPEYIQHIPLQYLASYLGITQRHLSRIRKEITF